MFLLIRTLTYGSLFVAFLLVFLPARVLEWSGVMRPNAIGPLQVVGALVVLAGAVLAAACVVAFAWLGRGTPAPFDPPRRLVVSGPYRWIRNPMYLGATLALLGAALFYQSLPLAGYTLLFIAVAHLFVRLYEEPTLARKFGREYVEYRSRVGRWLPRGNRRRHRDGATC